MSDFNIREMRAQYQAEEAIVEKSSRAFGIAVMIIPVFAAMAGFAYGPIMEFRNSNSQAIYLAGLETSDPNNPVTVDDFAKIAKGQFEGAMAVRRMQNSMVKDPETGLIDPNNPFGTNQNKVESEASKYRKKIRREGLPVKDYITGVDAKHAGFSPDDIKHLKYNRVKSALGSCGYSDLRKFYENQNRHKYEKIDKVKQAAEDAKRQKSIATVEEASAKIKQSQEEMSKVKTKGDALKFIAGGGGRRHAESSMQMFTGMDGMLSGGGSYEVKQRRQKHSQKQCMMIRTMVQGGKLNL